ncbi:hypothetical protein CDD80_3455 [Ophiocordyceps camponoti-rufipedis]|uniref:Endonuclease/exonuclease/phosphatase domain-containing protein n=1 Tax=Ophiocordyceps camponoti-rufipedis TaxID=2004952 RepID=A0A2C5Z2E2_9HYPO|nr:hypothetical protein CDD80_3455 [Ophiocordyceps camponoti-rufipedis]
MNAHAMHQSCTANIRLAQSVDSFISSRLVQKDALQPVMEYTGSGVILTGDLNAHHPLWSPEDMSSDARSRLRLQTRSDYLIESALALLPCPLLIWPHRAFALPIG